MLQSCLAGRSFPEEHAQPKCTWGRGRSQATRILQEPTHTLAPLPPPLLAAGRDHQGGRSLKRKAHAKAVTGRQHGSSFP